MKSTEDRRCSSAVRVAHTALVDICSLQQDGLPFQGESSNISGRGMQVRGSYLPEVGETLVCRFSHGSAEVLVEGRVAWRSEGEDSGEFGIQFTALDADSAELLKSLGEKRTQPSFAPTTTSLLDDPDDDAFSLESGERVRLHIDGLGAPMKGSVVAGTARKVKVGSALEFLKMGRKVELEEIIGGERRGALVDAVNVVIHPTTMVPELVVQLRYEGVSPTPPPARASVSSVPGPRRDYSASDGVDDEALDDEEHHLLEPTAEALRARLNGAVQSASSVAQKASGMISHLAQSAKDRIDTLRPAAVRRTTPVHRTASKTSRGGTLERSPTPKRRSATLRPSQSTPSHLRSGIHDLNIARGAQHPLKSQEPRSTGPTTKAAGKVSAGRKWSHGWIAAGALVFFGGSALALRTLSDPAETAVLVQAQPASATPEKPAALRNPVALSKPTKVEDEGGIVAEVPLFGAQAVAPTVPSAPTERLSDAEAEKRAAAAAVEDQTFEEPEEVVVSPKDKPWGHGRLYLPTIHRIRLDAAGSALSGAVQSDGFTVVIPGRKVMESGKAIQKRDKRIVAVKADNEGPNAKVRFEFRGPVPPYRVRLRQDFVEFLISAPEESVAQL